MGRLWLTKSVTTDFDGAWTQEEKLLDFDISSFSVNIYNNPQGIDQIGLTFAGSEAGYDHGVWYSTFPVNNIPSLSLLQVSAIDPSYITFAKPVIALNNYYTYVVYRESTQSGLKFYDQNSHYTVNLTTASSKNPSLVIDNNSNFYLTYQENSNIFYSWGLYPTTVAKVNVSSGSSYTQNINPSISIYKNGYVFHPIVSWTAYNEGSEPIESGDLIRRTLTRVYSANGWGTCEVRGENVGTSQNSSSLWYDNQSVIAWVQNSGTEVKWMRREGSRYSSTYCAEPTGNYLALSNGTSLSNIKMFTVGSNNPPYILSNISMDFSGTPECDIELPKLIKDQIYSGTLFSRSGSIVKNGINFVFNLGNLVVNDSAIKFIERADTLLYTLTDSLNQALITEPFALDQNSNVWFSSSYYVLNKDLADSVLNVNDRVSFKVELVDAIDGNVKGTFDNIEYSKNNLNAFENILYIIDCSGIQPGNYFLRLVTGTIGEMEYYLVNMETEDINLAKAQLNELYYDGSLKDENYALEQNYPNPFNPDTRIKFAVPKETNVKINVFNILGERIAELKNEVMKPGYYEVNFKAGSLPSGVYFYTLETQEFTSTKKMVLIK